MTPGDVSYHPNAWARRQGHGEGQRAFRAADQLAAILAAGDLPPGVRALGEEVQARLSSPVRIAVIGRPNAGKKRIVNGLLGGDVLPPLDGLPPAEISVGQGNKAEAVDGAGRAHMIPRSALMQVDPLALAFLRLSAPLPLLEKVNFLVVPLEGATEEIEAALTWAYTRSDMVLWCSPSLGNTDALLWPGLPEALQDHAFLAVTDPPSGRPAEAERMHAACYFREARNLGDDEASADRITGLRTALLAHVSMARREDLEGALVFLDQHLTRPSRTTLRAPAHKRSRILSRPDPMLEQVAEAAERVRSEGHLTSPTSEQRAEHVDVPVPVDQAATPGNPPAAEVISLLASRAEALSDLADSAKPEGSEGLYRCMLDICAEALEEGIRLVGPKEDSLSDALAEASDLILLMQLEASAGAASDGAALLLQVRRECEAQLAA